MTVIKWAHGYFGCIPVAASMYPPTALSGQENYKLQIRNTTSLFLPRLQQLLFSSVTATEICTASRLHLALCRRNSGHLSLTSIFLKVCRVQLGDPAYE